MPSSDYSDETAVEQPGKRLLDWKLLNPIHLVRQIISLVFLCVYVTGQYIIVLLFAPKPPKEPFVPRGKIAVIGAGLTVRMERISTRIRN
jgi:hypothetical protein